MLSNPLAIPMWDTLLGTPIFVCLVPTCPGSLGFCIGRMEVRTSFGDKWIYFWIKVVKAEAQRIWVG